jgi:cell shape-determining protein MreD
VSFLSPIAVLAASYLAVFLASRFDFWRDLAGAQFDLLPAIMVYCGLKRRLSLVGANAIFAGVLFDTLSANPLGITVIPLFLAGAAIHWHRELLLRDRIFSQFVLGMAASAGVPLASLLLLWLGGHHPLVGAGSLWQWLMLILTGGAATPMVCHLLDRIHESLTFQIAPEPRYRTDREIKRGRI